MDRGAYIFCVLEQFCRHLKHREIYAGASARYRNPQARLLDGAEWEAVKDDALTTLGLPENPDALLASHVTDLDEALKYVAGGLAANADVRVDEAERIHLTSDKAVQDPPSLVDLRKRVAAMLPRVDIGEQILEVMGWVPEFLESLTALSGGAARMADLNVTAAAALTGQALNIGYGPVSTPGVPSLERRRIGHVGRTYLRAAGYTAANPHLIARLVLHAEPVAHELPVPLGRPVRLHLRGHLPGQPQQAAYLADHRIRDLIQLREVAQPLIALQPHYQRQQGCPVVVFLRAQATSSSAGVNTSASSRADTIRANRG